MKIRLAFYIFSVSFLLGFLTGLYYFITLFKNYETLISFLLPYTQSEHQIEKLKNQILTPYKFEILKYLLSIFFATVFLFFIWIYNIRSKLIFQIEVQWKIYQNLIQKVFNLLNHLKNAQKWTLCITFLTFTSLRIYFVFQYSLTYDEIYIWEEFVQRGFFVIISYYPIHGNHILQTLISLIFSFLEPIWALRLPSIFFAFCLDFLLFIWLYYKSQNFTKSLLAILLFGLLYVNFIHSFLGRGYQLGMLLSWIIFVFYERRWNTKFFYETIILQILLLYTLPSGLFFLIPFWILNYKQKLLKTIILTGFGSSILYLPIFLFLNPKDLLSGAYYQKNTWNYQLKFFNQIWQFPDFWNIHYSVGLFITIFFFIILIRKWNFESKIFSIYLMMIISFGLLTSFPAKAFMPLSFLFPILFLWVELPKRHFLTLGIGILTSLILIYSNKKEFETQFKNHFSAYEFAKQIYKIYPKNLSIQIELSPLNETDAYYLCLKHIYHQQELKVDLDAKSSIVLESIKLNSYGKIILKDENMKIVFKD